MSFIENKYIVVRGAISKDLAEVSRQYLFNKREVARTLANANHPAYSSGFFGTWSDSQIPDTYSLYGDLLMETLLQKVKPIMERETGLTLVETYAYTRIYKKGDILHRHKDRPSCEISTTLNLGGPAWPIFLEPDSSKGYSTDQGYIPGNTAGVQVDMEPGDMLIYRGCELEHWREAAPDDGTTQVFLHYNNAFSPRAKENKFDTRPHLGLSPAFKTQ